jgi:hypothetical protein
MCQKVIPPYSAPPIAFALALWYANEQHRTGDDDWSKEDEKVDKPGCCPDGLPYIVSE